MKYQRRCPRCGKMRDDWKFNSVEEGVWIKSICDDCLEISPSIPIIKEESEEHRVETDAKDSSPLPQEVAAITSRGCGQYRCDRTFRDRGRRRG